MSYLYDQYLTDHKSNVKKGFDWIRDNLPELMNQEFDLEHQICFAHDQSKTKQDEYDAYDAYFYGGNRSFSVIQEFKKAWLLHIHRNPHHWQYWILINDDPEEGEVLIEMPYNYILEMICDWWAFSWAKGNLNDIFTWYDKHKDYIKLHQNTRNTVEFILNQIKTKLEGENKMNFKVIATDFDGTLCENKWPDIGEPNEEIIRYLREQQAAGVKIILWTCRVGERLEEAVRWCYNQGLIFDAVNENVPEAIDLFGSDTRKIFANEYIDDRMSTRFKLPFLKGEK